MDPKKTGRIISESRKVMNMTQKNLAQKLFITDKAISKWERGLSFPDISTLIPLTETLNISLYDLLKGADMNKKEVEKVLKNTIEYSTKEIKQNKKKFLKVFLGISLSLIALILFCSFICKYEFTVEYNKDIVKVKIPEDQGLDININLSNYKNANAILVPTDKNSYDLYMNVTQTLFTKIFNDNDKSSHLLRAGNKMIVDFQSEKLREYVPNGNDIESIKKVYYVNNLKNIAIMSDDELTKYKDKVLIWERD